jgi:hypothetical protein
MKKLLVLSVVLIATGCTIFGGTDQEDGGAIYYNYKIVNDSGTDIEIIPYNKDGVKDYKNQIVLKNGQNINKLIKTKNNFGSDRLTMSQLLYTNGFLTKIEVVFNNTRKSTFTDDCIYNNGVSTNCNSRNIFLLEYNDDKTEVYTITPEDYQNAVDCGGNCN